ncbi:hypothetical protein EVB81_143 [Rhizobium phage RHph_I46]|uniref:Uncharacterized protein n=1 Tax=Rhizobium phage RHph_I1_9 TaxID=2509729 RepID=A0A7S5RIM1_9CAUD|nr:hypothetical protein PP936_gp142 [Rhizobium phage RHph_I1_9]QIG69712.1 hypothetical protein EVB81_143 [Rhizobium phage RHph_I46]QIG70993.1 hypothetical protein EVB92_143 [Rhizobium phage RHph_I9]QIG73579.1 hypothetical protein EVC04_142 [Rhizobium phage RHph_I1_9]QIG76332.1 hypothetical protein EVC25_143 [Rhizobium phage RHph_I34]
MNFFSFENKTIEQKIAELDDLVNAHKARMKDLEVMKNQKDVKILLRAYETRDIPKLLSHPLGQSFLEAMFPTDEISFFWDDTRFQVFLKPTSVDFMQYEFDPITRMYIWELYKYAAMFTSHIGNQALTFTAEDGDLLMRFRAYHTDDLKTADEIMSAVINLHASFPYQQFPKRKE